MSSTNVSPNDVLRFLLELAALAAIGYWGVTAHAGFASLLWAGGGVLLAATLWGVFRVPDDPSSAGSAPVSVPGPIRLVLELLLLGGSVVLLAAAGRPLAAAVLGLLLVLHYTLAWRRVRWLLGGDHPTERA